MLDRLELADAVGIDIIMAEPSEEDEGLAASIRKLKKVVLPAYLDEHGEIIFPAATLHAPKTGHVHIEMDADGVARNIYHKLANDGTYVRSFTSVILGSKTISEFHFFGQFKDLCSPGIIQSDLMVVNFYGRSGTFRRIPFYEILTGRWPPDTFRNRIVLVGVTSPGIENGLVVPFTNARDRMPGVEFHANVLGNLLDGSFIRPVPAWVTYLGVIILTALAFVLFPRVQAMPAFFLCLGGLLVLTTATYVLLVRAYIWLPPGALWAAIAAAFVSMQHYGA